MVRLTWGETGQRYYETGVDRGVLFVPGLPGVPWNGLTSVSESTEGGEVTGYYIDGYKYQNHVAYEEFAATIEAYSAPKEFDICDGNVSAFAGLIITNQRRSEFSFSYRTRIGNDIDGVDHGYKIHIVYNALAAPSDVSNESVGDSVDPMVYSWQISTKPPKINLFRPTAHFVIDSRYTVPSVLSEIEDIIYGTETDVPRLPLVDELVEMFTIAPIDGMNNG